MAGASVQGFEALAGLQQIQGSQAQGLAKNKDVDELGQFGALMERAAEVLEAAKTAKGVAVDQDMIARPQAKTDTGLDFKAVSRTDRQNAVKDQTDRSGTNNKENTKISQEDNNNARVTDDKEGKDLQSAADDAGRKIISETAEKLDVDEAEVVAAMETLGLSAIQLLDPANIAALLTELSGESDPMVLVTDAELYTALQDLTETANDLSAELGLTPEMVPAFTKIMSGEEMPQILPQETVSVEQDLQTALTAEEGPKTEDDADTIRFSVTQTDEEGNTVQVEVTMDKSGQVVNATVENPHHEEGGEQQHGGGHRQSGSHEADPMKLADEVMNQIAGRMTETPVNFNDVIPTEQIAGTQTQEMVEIVRQITEQIRVNFGADVTSMELTLHPASLGNVQITVAADAQGRMVAQFAVENETVRQAVESQLSTLQQRLDEQGVKIEAVEVTLASHAFEGNLNQGGGQETNEQREEQMRAAGAGRRRNINLADLNLEEEDLAEEERIAAEMMAANGNTVDYTA